MVESFKTSILAGEWDYEGRGATFVFWQEGGTVWISEGHHRANAALEIGRKTGDWRFLRWLLQYGKREPGLPPTGQRGRFPTRGWLSRLLSMLGW